MNKKFLSAVLFGALMVSSTGTFVSCKDYDEELTASTRNWSISSRLFQLYRQKLMLVSMLPT